MGAQLTVLKDVTCTFPEEASFGSSNHPAASLDITVAQGASLSAPCRSSWPTSR